MKEESKSEAVESAVVESPPVSEVTEKPIAPSPSVDDSLDMTAKVANCFLAAKAKYNAATEKE